MSNIHKDTSDLTELQARRPSWWKLPFDPVTNFSLFGFFLGVLGWPASRKRTDFTLKDE